MACAMVLRRSLSSSPAADSPPAAGAERPFCLGPWWDMLTPFTVTSAKRRFRSTERNSLFLSQKKTTSPSAGKRVCKPRARRSLICWRPGSPATPRVAFCVFTPDRGRCGCSSSRRGWTRRWSPGGNWGGALGCESRCLRRPQRFFRESGSAVAALHIACAPRNSRFCPPALAPPSAQHLRMSCAGGGARPSPCTRGRKGAHLDAWQRYRAGFSNAAPGSRLSMPCRGLISGPCQVTLDAATCPRKTAVYYGRLSGGGEGS